MKCLGAWRLLDYPTTTLNDCHRDWKTLNVIEISDLVLWFAEDLAPRTRRLSALGNQLALHDGGIMAVKPLVVTFCVSEIMDGGP